MEGVDICGRGHSLPSENEIQSVQTNTLLQVSDHPISSPSISGSSNVSTTYSNQSSEGHFANKCSTIIDKKVLGCDEENIANKLVEGKKIESRRLTDEEFVLLMNAPLFLIVLELGFSEEKVKEILLCKFHQTGLPFHTTDDLIDTILFHESDNGTCNENEI
jgi:hypothetical protein